MSLLKLSMHRDDLEARNARTPERLPALWARLGDFDRAEALARSISDPKRRADAVYELVVPLVRDGQVDRAERIAAEAVDEARFPIVGQCLVTEVAAAGDLPRAMAMAEAIGNASWRSRALLTLPAPRPLTDVASMLAAADEIADDDARTNTRYFVARRLIEQGEAARAVAVAENFDHRLRVNVIERAARRLRDDGDPEGAADLLASAGPAAQEVVFRLELEDLARADLELAKEKVFGLGSGRRGQSVCDLVELAVGQGCVDFAESLLDFLPPVDGKRELLLALEEAAAQDGYERAMGILAKKFEESSAYFGPETRAAALTAIAEGMLKSGDTTTAKNVAVRAESVARSLDDADRYERSFRCVIDFVVATHDVPTAERLARILLASTVDRHDFTGIAVLLAESGDGELAERVVFRLERAEALTEAAIPLLRRLRTAGAEEKVRGIVREFEARVAGRHLQGNRLVDFYCAAGLPDQALRLAWTMGKAQQRDRAYEAVVRELCAVGQVKSAVEVVRSQFGDGEAASRLSVSLAEAMGAAGYGDGLEVLAGLGAELRPGTAVAYLERLAERDFERALHLAGTALPEYQRISVLLAMARRVAEPARSRLLVEVAQSNEWPSILSALQPDEYPGVTEVVDQYIRLQEARVGLDRESG
ncbi:hypothetical protein AB0L41_05265 [Amycolatopsis mediterranei]|uniref:hypothetical protein n=1 Tax=Amycolatopsis mediterranei TaxID=33910 RepID=UPI0034393F21